jgi:hypothetical protein
MQYANSSTTPIDNYNVAVGFEALRGNGGPSNTGVENTAIGSQSLLANSSGSYNSASGTGALYSNTTGSLNAAMGWQALLRNISGNGNCANGYNSLQYNTSGSAIPQLVTMQALQLVPSIIPSRLETVHL